MRAASSFALLLIGIAFAGCTSAGDAEAARVYYSRRPTIDFPSAPSVVTLVRGKDGRAYVTARIAGREILLLVDTGAAMTIIDERVISLAKVATVRAPFGTLYGGSGGVESSVARLPILEVGGVRIVDCPVFVQNLDDWNKRELATQKTRIDGIFGSGLMELLGVEIDYRSNTMKIEGPNQALLPTPTAVTPAASHPSRQP